MKQAYIRFGNFSVQLPDQHSADFIIFANLADLYSVKYQSEAVALLEADLSALNLKPKPQIDYESDYTDIRSNNANTIFAVSQCIYRRTVTQRQIGLSADEIDDIKNRLEHWKRPASQNWNIGDIFSIPLQQGRYGFGQVVGTYKTAQQPVCALFDIIKPVPEITAAECARAQIFSVQNTHGECLSDGTFTVLLNTSLCIEPSMAPAGRSNADTSLIQLANAWHGFTPWNILYREDFYDDLLLPGVTRPSTSIWLNADERARWRKEQLHIDN